MKKEKKEFGKKVLQNPNFKKDFPIEEIDLERNYEPKNLFYLKYHSDKIIKIFADFAIFKKDGKLILFNNFRDLDFGNETILPSNFDAENLEKFGAFFKNKNGIYFFDGSKLRLTEIDGSCAENINYNFIAEKKSGGRVFKFDFVQLQLIEITEADGETFQKDKIQNPIFDETGNPALIEFSDQKNYYNYSGKILGTKEEIDGQLEIFEKLHNEPKLNNDEIIYLTTEDGKPSKNVRASLRPGSSYFSYLKRKLVAEIISENNSKK